MCMNLTTESKNIQSKINDRTKRKKRYSKIFIDENSTSSLSKKSVNKEI